MTGQAKNAVNVIQSQLKNFSPKLGIILGSGNAIVARAIENAHVIPYKDFPSYPACSVEGHEAKFFAGTLAGKSVAVLAGRPHFYEGISNDDALTLVRTLKLLGCEALLSINSAGSMNPNIHIGDFVVINDHINFQFRNALSGKNDKDFGPRFFDMTNAYDPSMREKLLSSSKKNHIKAIEGVYFATLGPSFETPAEIRAFRMLGGDVVGMSTISEVMAANHCGMKVAVMSVITNMAAGLSDVELAHEVTLSGAKKAENDLLKLVEDFVGLY